MFAVVDCGLLLLMCVCLLLHPAVAVLCISRVLSNYPPPPHPFKPKLLNDSRVINVALLHIVRVT